MSSSKDSGFKDQITRSSLSVSSNIAEGYGRDTNKDLMRFLYISKGSCCELETQIMIGMKINYIEKIITDKWLKEAEETSVMIGGLIQKRKQFS